MNKEEKKKTFFSFYNSTKRIQWFVIFQLLRQIQNEKLDGFTREKDLFFKGKQSLKALIVISLVVLTKKYFFLRVKISTFSLLVGQNIGESGTQSDRSSF